MKSNHILQKRKVLSLEAVQYCTCWNSGCVWAAVQDADSVVGRTVCLYPDVFICERGKGRSKEQNLNVMKIFLPKTVHLSCLLIAIKSFQEGIRAVLLFLK